MNFLRPKRLSISYKNLSARGVPTHLHTFTLSDFKTNGEEDLIELKKYMQHYLDNIQENFSNNKGLFLYGSNGVGKTTLASLIVKEAYINRFTSKRCTLMEYIKAYTNIWNAVNNEERQNLEEKFYSDFKSVEFLVLEELGKETDTKVVAPILEDCLRYREDKGLVTIFCSNVDTDILGKKYGNSILSLIMGNTTKISIVVKDKRLETYKRR